MSYTRPAFDAADASWQGATPYTRPAFDAADATWQAATPSDYGGTPSAFAAPALAITQANALTDIAPQSAASGVVVQPVNRITGTASGFASDAIFSELTKRRPLPTPSSFASSPLGTTARNYVTPTESSAAYSSLTFSQVAALGGTASLFSAQPLGVTAVSRYGSTSSAFEAPALSTGNSTSLATTGSLYASNPVTTTARNTATSYSNAPGYGAVALDGVQFLLHTESLYASSDVASAATAALGSTTTSFASSELFAESTDSLAATPSQFTSSAVQLHQTNALSTTQSDFDANLLTHIPGSIFPALFSTPSSFDAGWMRFKDTYLSPSVLLSDDIALDLIPLYTLTKSDVRERVDVELVQQALYPHQTTYNLFTRERVEVLFVEEEQWQAQ